MSKGDKIPSRKQTDKLAGKLDRKNDGLGRPLDDKGKRFFGLRDSGYKGWIDQDGYPSKGSTKW